MRSGLCALRSLVAEAEARHHAGPEILHQRRRRSRRARETSPCRRRLLRSSTTERLPAFCARNETPMLRAVELRPTRRAGARDRRRRRFDLDDVGAEQRELIAAVRPGQHVGEVEHADAGEEWGHEAIELAPCIRRSACCAQRAASARDRTRTVRPLDLRALLRCASGSRPRLRLSYASPPAIARRSRACSTARTASGRAAEQRDRSKRPTAAR